MVVTMNTGKERSTEAEPSANPSVSPSAAPTALTTVPTTATPIATPTTPNTATSITSTKRRSSRRHRTILPDSEKTEEGLPLCPKRPPQAQIDGYRKQWEFLHNVCLSDEEIEHRIMSATFFLLERGISSTSDLQSDNQSYHRFSQDNHTRLYHEDQHHQCQHHQSQHHQSEHESQHQSTSQTKLPSFASSFGENTLSRHPPASPRFSFAPQHRLPSIPESPSRMAERERPAKAIPNGSHRGPSFPPWAWHQPLAGWYDKGPAGREEAPRECNCPPPAEKEAPREYSPAHAGPPTVPSAAPSSAAASSFAPFTLSAGVVSNAAHIDATANGNSLTILASAALEIHSRPVLEFESRKDDEIGNSAPTKRRAAAAAAAARSMPPPPLPPRPQPDPNPEGSGSKTQQQSARNEKKRRSPRAADGGEEEAGPSKRVRTVVEETI